MNVTLELVDAASGATLSTDEVPVASLPERFEGFETHLDVGPDRYRVVGADPDTRDAIAAAGRVRLLAERVVAVDPRTIRFSLPTLEDARAPVDAAADAADAIYLHEDDWRQTELVAAALRAEVDAELADVRAVKHDGDGGAGYARMHVRRRIPAPLPGVTLRLEALAAAVEATPRPLALRGVGVVRDGFALPRGDALVYGTAPGGVVTALAVHGIPDDVVGLLHPIALRHKLLLVEWCVPRALRALDAGFAH